jgi:hypothetical protein
MAKFAVILTFLLILIFQSGCSIFDDSPQAVYEQFRHACIDSNIDMAHTLLATQSEVPPGSSGICIILLPDGLNIISGTKQIMLENMNPSVEINGEIAYLTWSTEFGSKIIMSMNEENGDWKIVDT